MMEREVDKLAIDLCRSIDDCDGTLDTLKKTIIAKSPICGLAELVDYLDHIQRVVCEAGVFALALYELMKEKE